MVLKYVVGKAATVLEDLRVKIYEAQNDNPGAEVYTELLVQPGGPGTGHPNEHIVTANGLDLLVHIVYLYGETSGFLYERYTAEAKLPVVTIFSPIRFKIGDGGILTPVAETNEYTNPLLIGLTTDQFIIYRKNVGPMYPLLDYTFFPLIGKIQLNGADVFHEENPGEGEEFTIQLQPKVVETVVNDSVVGKDFGGFYDIAVDTVYNNAAHLRKLGRFSGTCKYTFQVGDNIPIGYPFRFQHFGAAGTGTIEFLNFPLRWTGGDKASLDLPNLCEISVVFDGAKWNIVWLSSSSNVFPPAAPPAGTILGAGLFAIGNLPGGDPEYTIIHNKAIAGDYLVLFSLKGTQATRAFDNDVIAVWYHHATDKPNKFIICIEEKSPNNQNITIAWTLIKL